MLHTIPNQFHLAQYIYKSALHQLQLEHNALKYQVFFSKRPEQTYIMMVSSEYIAFDLIQSSDITWGCYVPLVRDLRLQKLFQKNRTHQIIGLKLIYQKQELEIIIKHQECVSECIEKLAKQVTQIGFHEQFRPLRKIGKGGFATVYEVKRIPDGQTFAVKAFSKAQAFSTPASKASLQNQIAILKMIDQENLLSLYQVFESENSLYFVMELYSGGDFASLIRKNQANFTSKQIQKFMFDLLKGLKALNELNIMHRDIKPENIMIRTVGDTKQLVIGDFGLASKTNIQKYLLQKCGTPGYVAPQIVHFKQGENLTSKCDIFSLGVIFHILLCKNHLFRGNNCDQVYERNKNMDFNLNHQKYKNVNAQAMNLLKKMLHEDPKQRISAAQAMDCLYFWPLNEYSKLQSTPETVCSPNLFRQVDLRRDFSSIDQRFLSPNQFV